MRYACIVRVEDLAGEKSSRLIEVQASSRHEAEEAAIARVAGESPILRSAYVSTTVEDPVPHGERLPDPPEPPRVHGRPSELARTWHPAEMLRRSRRRQRQAPAAAA